MQRKGEQVFPQMHNNDHATAATVHQRAETALLGKESQQPRQTVADRQIYEEEEDCRNCRKHEYHRRGQQHFAAGRPDDLTDFGSDLLDLSLIHISEPTRPY